MRATYLRVHCVRPGSFSGSKAGISRGYPIVHDDSGSRANGATHDRRADPKSAAAANTARYHARPDIISRAACAGIVTDHDHAGGAIIGGESNLFR